MRLFYRKKVDDFKREIYFCGIKIFSYFKQGYDKYSAYSVSNNFLYKVNCSVLRVDCKIFITINDDSSLDCLLLPNMRKYGYNKIKLYYETEFCEMLEIEINRKDLYCSEVNKNDLIILLNGLKTNSILIKFSTDYLIDNIELFALNGNNKTIIACRIDGFGERMCALLNTIYLSKILNCNFNFVWPDIKNVENVNFVIQGLDSSIFSNIYLQKHLYRNTHNNLLNMHLFNNGHSSIYDFKATKTECIMFNNQDFLYFKDLNDFHYRKSLKNIWKEIGFSDKLKSVISDADSYSDNIGDFIAIHMRCGDVICSTTKTFLYKNKAANIPLFIEIIKESIAKKLKIVIFSNDMYAVDSVKSYFSFWNCSIFSINDFVNFKFNNEQEKSIFEITLMSKALKIYSTQSGFSRLAAMVGNIEYINIYNIFSLDKQFNITLDILNNIKLPDYHLAFSYMYLYFLSRELLVLSVDKHKYISRAFSLNPSNMSYCVLFINSLFEEKLIKEAGSLLKSILNSNLDIFLNELFLIDNNSYLYVDFFYNCIEHIKYDKYIYILAILIYNRVYQDNPSKFKVDFCVLNYCEIFSLMEEVGIDLFETNFTEFVLANLNKE